MELILFVDVDEMAHPADNQTVANKVPFVYSAASLSLMTVSFFLLLLIILVHVMTNYSIRGQLDSYLVTIIVAGTRLSFLFVILISVFATNFSEATDAWRVRTVLSMIAKGFREGASCFLSDCLPPRLPPALCV